MRLWRLGTALVAFALSSTPVFAALQDTQLAAMESLLQRNGSKAVLEKYFDCQDGPGYALVGSGDPRAIKLSMALRPALDACVGEGMTVAWGQAMSNNPELMLSYYSQMPMDLPQWCVPGIYEPSNAQWRAAVDKADKAIRHFHNPRLLVQRNICLGLILLCKSEAPYSHGKP